MELREFAERVLFASSLEEKLLAPALITDEQPGNSLSAPGAPGRPVELRFKAQHRGKADPPGVHALDRAEERGRLLHFFANHELLATELMALALLRFPDAPPAFRRAILQTLKDEQDHTRWYVERMQACGVHFGEWPVSGYFWRSISAMESPLDYVVGLSLTFEQANLDFARFFARGFSQAGDLESSRLLEKIYQDEIGHVAVGLKWFRKWKTPDQSDWDAFRSHLRFPLSAQRAKGPEFNVEGRRAAGFDRTFIDELRVYSHSRGRTPGVFVFNPFAEGHIALGKAFTPNKHQQLLRGDLENLCQFLCRQDDVVLVSRRPSTAFLAHLSAAGCAIPEFVEVPASGLDPASELGRRKIGRLRPWAWGPDSLELLRPLFPNVTGPGHDPDKYYNNAVAALYSKEWSAGFLRRLLERAAIGDREYVGPSRSGPPGSWLCGPNEAGLGAGTFDEALALIEAIRGRGHRAIVLKQSFGVAGQNAIRLLEPELLDTQRRWIAGVLDKGIRLVVEPWLEREADFSVQFEMSDAGLKLVGYTGLDNDWRGQFQGNWAWPGFERRLPLDLAALFPGVPAISDRIRKLYATIRDLLEPELRAVGYRGPLGLDAFVYRASDGCRLKPIVEINPRYTMGRLMLELMQHVAPGSRGRFRLVSRRQAEAEGHQNLAAWARAFRERHPTRLQGQPVPRIREGALCVSDPERAQVCLAVFEVETSNTSGLPTRR